MLYAFLVFCLVGSACAKLSQSFEDGCPDLEVEPAFDISKYLGRWYYDKYMCVAADYRPGENGTIQFALNNYVSLSSSTMGRLGQTTKGILRVTDASESAKLKENIYKPLKSTNNYWVLGTDYDSFAVVFSCYIPKFKNTPVGETWLLTRKQSPAAIVTKKANEVLAKNKIFKSSFSEENSRICEDLKGKLYGPVTPYHSKPHKI